jgi:hypothetical protein
MTQQATANVKDRNQGLLLLLKPPSVKKPEYLHSEANGSMDMDIVDGGNCVQAAGMVKQTLDRHAQGTV